MGLLRPAVYFCQPIIMELKRFSHLSGILSYLMGWVAMGVTFFVTSDAQEKHKVNNNYHHKKIVQRL